MQVDEAKRALAGAMISVATPVTSAFDLDLETLRRNLEFMLAGGADRGSAVFLVAAAGGEFPMLSLEQRKQVIATSCEAVAGRVSVVASLQTNSTREAIELARFCKDAGVTVGQLSSPFYYTPTPADIQRFFSDVASQGGLPIMVYNNWWNTLNMNVDTVTRLAEIDGIVALKWSAPAQSQYREGYQRLRDRLAIIDNASDHVTASLLGADGFITHISNFWPAYPRRLWSLMQAREFEALRDALAFKWEWRRWTARVTEYTEGEGPFIKAAMDEVGLRSGDPIPPGLPVPQDLRSELRDLFARYNVPRADAVSVG
ncbi:MAG: dihydrodipicolinate synthase family protein [Candidatus Dormibacteraceae bacterium]